MRAMAPTPNALTSTSFRAALAPAGLTLAGLTLAGLTLAALTLAACSSGPELTDPRDLMIGQWTITAIDGAPVPDASEATLEFTSDGVVGGNASLNRLRGSYEVTDGGLRFSRLVTTRRAGPPQLMEQEQRVLAAMEATASVRRDGEELLLCDEGGTVRLRARPGKP